MKILSSLRYPVLSSVARTGRKPYLAGNLVASSILHGGPGPQCLSENVFYLILDQEEKVVLAPAVSAMVDESSGKLARELMESKTDDQLEELNRINSDWLLEQGISTYTVLCKSNANDN